MSAPQPRRAEEHGISRSLFYRRVAAGEYDRIARGLYVPADAASADWDWLEAAARRPEATVCLVSALAHYELIDDIPAVLDVAIPRGVRAPASTGGIEWHHFAADTFEVGRTSMEIPGSSVRIGIYSAERSIADAFRMRGKVGYEVPRAALREWLRRGGKPADLMKIATRLPRTIGPVMQMLEALT